MEEAVWMYFGVLVIILTIAIITTVFIHYNDDATEQEFFESIQYLEKQIDTICKAPLDTQLSITVAAPAHSMLFTREDRVCGSFNNKIRCVPASCPLVPATLLNLTDVDLFKTHEYTCTVLRGNQTNVTCSG